MSNIEKLKIRYQSVWETMSNGQEVEKKEQTVSPIEIAHKLNEVIDYLNEQNPTVIQCKKPAAWLPLEDLFKEAVDILKTFDNLNFAEQSEEFQSHCYELHKFLEKVGAVDE